MKRATALPHPPSSPSASARGAVVAEVAVTAPLFLLVIIAIIEFSRYMLTYDAASEATRLAARMYAASCDTSTTRQQQIRDAVRIWGNAGGYSVPANWLDLQRSTCGTGCEVAMASIRQSVATCGDGTALVGRLMLPGLSDLVCLPVPAFTATALRESGGSGCN